MSDKEDLKLFEIKLLRRELSKRQILLILLIHGILTIAIPITLISSINSLYIELILFILWFYMFTTYSYWIQLHITGKIARWLRIIN